MPHPVGGAVGVTLSRADSSLLSFDRLQAPSQLFYSSSKVFSRDLKVFQSSKLT